MDCLLAWINLLPMDFKETQFPSNKKCPFFGDPHHRVCFNWEWILGGSLATLVLLAQQTSNGANALIKKWMFIPQLQLYL
jgi:hypothetical protein